MPDSDPGKSGAPENCRPWCRLHASTICLLVAAAIVLVLLVVPGEHTVVRTPAKDYLWRESQWWFEHGWPCIYLRRTDISSQSYEPAFDIPWLWRPAWSFRGEKRDFRPSILVVDLLTTLLLLGAIGVGAEWRRRRHVHFWQYSIAEMLILTILIAAGLGWYQHNKQVHDREMNIAPNDIFSVSESVTFDYRGPRWLRKLGGRKHFPILYRVSEVSLWWNDDQKLKRRVRELEGLSSLESLTIGFAFETGAGLEGLRKLPQLRDLTVSWTCITDAGLAHVERLGNPRTLSLDRTEITGADLKHLKELKQLESLDLQNTGVDDTDLAYLSGLENLRFLYLDGPQLDGSGLLHLKDLKNLEIVYFVGSPVKTEYIDQFRQVQTGSTEVLRFKRTPLSAPKVKLRPMTQPAVDDTM